MKLSANAQASINKVIEKFEKGDISPISKIVRIQLDPSAPARKWSLSNRVISFIQSGELDCRGFRQWEKAGRKIKKGSKAVYILSPITIKQSHEENGETVEEYICLGFSSVPVFAASSTYGDAAIPGYTPAMLPDCASLAEKLGISVEFVPVPPDRLGDCTKDGKKIRLGTHNPAVFFHELAHAIHARISGELIGGQTAEQETIAEFTAAVLMDIYGYSDNTGNAWRYISQYAKDPLVAITKAMGTIEKVVDFISESG